MGHESGRTGPALRCLQHSGTGPCQHSRVGPGDIDVDEWPMGVRAGALPPPLADYFIG